MVTRRPAPIVPIIAGAIAGGTSGAASGISQRQPMDPKSWAAAVTQAGTGTEKPDIPIGGSASLPGAEASGTAAVKEVDTTQPYTLARQDWNIFTGPQPISAPANTSGLLYAYQTGQIIENSILLPAIGTGDSFLLLDSVRWSNWLRDTYRSDAAVLGLKGLLFKNGYLKNADAFRRPGFDANTLDAAFLAFADLSSRNYDIARNGGRSLLGLEQYLNTAEGQRQATITTSVDIPTKGQSEATLIDAYQAYVGRAPSRREIAAFQEAVVNAASSRPRVTTSTPGTISETGEISGASQVTTGGFSVQDDLALMARKEAMEDPESGPYRMASKYFDAFLDVIGTPQGMGTPTEISKLLT